MQHGRVERLFYDRMVCASDGRGAWLYAPIAMVAQLVLLAVFWLLSNMVVDPVLAFVMVARVVEVHWAAYEDQVWFPYNYKYGAFVILPAVMPNLHRNTASVEVAEGDRAELCPKYHAKYKDRGMTLELARKAWTEHLVNGSITLSYRLLLMEMQLLHVQLLLRSLPS